MFLGWTPVLASYGVVLDPLAALRENGLLVFTDTIRLFEQRAWLHPGLGVLTLAGLVAAWIMYKLGWRSLWPIPAFLIWSALIWKFNAPGIGGPVEIGIHVVYAALAIAATYGFLRHGHLLSAGFIGYALLLLTDVALDATLLPGGLLGLLFQGYAPSLVNTLLFVAVALLVRMVWLMVRDNRAFVGKLSKSGLRSALKRTLLLWFPMPLLFLVAAGFWWGVANLWIKPGIEEKVAARTVDLEAEIAAWTEKQQLFIRREIGERHMGLPNELALLEIATAPRDNWIAEGPLFEDSLERSVREFNELQSGFSNIRMQYGVWRGRDRAWKDVAALPGEVGREIDTAFPEDDLPLMDAPDFCWPWEFGCKAEQFVAETTNDLMIDTRRNIRDGLVGGVSQAVNEGEKNIDKIAAEAALGTGTMYGTYADASKATLGTGFRTWRNISLLATVYSLILLGKTFLIVFSRVIFSPKNPSAVSAQFLPYAGPEGAPEITRHGKILRIPVDAPEAHFVARWGVTLEGPPPARRRPLGFRFPIARILTGTWVMNRIDGGRSPDDQEFDADLKVDEPAELVTWRLREGERVVFHFRDFIGMAETVRVRRIASLSITTLILGRMIYHVAEGPGTIILRTTAAARIGGEADADRPAPMPKLVAWGAGTHFGILAAETTIDTFLSGYNLKTEVGDAVVWDSSTRRGDGPGTGILRFAKSFLLPI